MNLKCSEEELAGEVGRMVIKGACQNLVLERADICLLRSSAATLIKDNAVENFSPHPVLLASRWRHFLYD